MTLIAAGRAGPQWHVLLTITTTGAPATDLGYVLHKHPGRLQSSAVSAGEAHVFRPEAASERCTAALLLEVEPIAPVRGRAGKNTAGRYRREHGARKVADLGCGAGALTTDLLADPRTEHVTATVLSARALQLTARDLERRPQPQADHLHSSLTYRDDRLNGLDAAVLTEVIEHLDPERLPAPTVRLRLRRAEDRRGHHAQRRVQPAFRRAGARGDAAPGPPEALDRAACGEPLWRVHECVFAVLALESEPVDPRL
jgi:hypothetical protein